MRNGFATRRRAGQAGTGGDGSGRTAASALLVAVAGGDRAALGELYAQTSPRLFAVAVRLMRRHDLAEEVLHDSFLRAWARAGSYDPGRGPAEAWLLTLVRHAAFDRLRRQGREVALEDVDAGGEGGDAAAAAEAGDPVELLALSADGQALARCLGDLEAEPRRCILLAYWHGYSHEELARLLGRPLGTVKSWVRRSLLRLRVCLER
jgi:RNA polymerase sigma-70 factor (ECF subfamily)